MTTDRLRDALSAVPFRPFTIHMADDRSLRIAQPEHVAYHQGGRTAIVIKDDESFEVVDLRLVASLEVTAAGGRRRR
jgi:hypothetical protein